MPIFVVVANLWPAIAVPAMLGKMNNSEIVECAVIFSGLVMVIWILFCIIFGGKRK